MSKSWAGLLMIVFSFPLSAWSGFVASRIWQWFAEPIGAPHIGTVRAMGLACLIGMYRYVGNRDADDEKTGGELFAQFLGRSFLVPLLTLGIAYLFAQLL